ncbi:MAG TPA: hypothetical protein VND62_05935 [Acidimicrobiales bacterium]|nr:hypothetical protein [Acidimicrobiales bacterium]
MAVGRATVAGTPWRERSFALARAETASYSSRLTMAGWAGSSDQIHTSGGFMRLWPFLRALRFQTWKPVYFGLRSTSHTLDRLHAPRAVAGWIGIGGG